MDGQKSQAKLTRTHSSLLRSSPTIRSSIHSFSSINEFGVDQEPDIEEQKPHKSGSTPICRGSFFSPFRSAPTRMAPVLVVLVYTLFVFFSRDNIPTSESLLLALIFVAVLLFFAGKKRESIHQRYNVFRNLLDEYGKRLGFHRNHSKPVQWFIGETKLGHKEGKSEIENRLVREGVEVYSNGDIYEGEYHKGRCNGSGVYNYFVKGRYEGDWVDGKYDGYGIESWARGSKYRGQYRQGLRHGYGVYKFYTGDTYAGQWCNGQSHGVGSQSCSDGSCYIGEFKCAVKHGLGCYHFR